MLDLFSPSSNPDAINTTQTKKVGKYTFSKEEALSHTRPQSIFACLFDSKGKLLKPFEVKGRTRGAPPNQVHYPIRLRPWEEEAEEWRDCPIVPGNEISNYFRYRSKEDQTLIEKPDGRLNFHNKHTGRQVSCSFQRVAFLAFRDEVVHRNDRIIINPLLEQEGNWTVEDLVIMSRGKDEGCEIDPYCRVRY